VGPEGSGTPQKGETMTQVNRRKYIESLVLADLDGAPLPEPSSTQEEEDLRLYQATRQLMRDEGQGALREGWTEEVWQRIAAGGSSPLGELAAALDEEADPASGQGDAAAQEGEGGGSAAAEEQAGADLGAAASESDAEAPAVVSLAEVRADRAKKMPWWPLLLAAAAAMLLVVFALQTRSVREEELARSSAPTMAYESSAKGDDAVLKELEASDEEAPIAQAKAEEGEAEEMDFDLPADRMEPVESALTPDLTVGASPPPPAPAEWAAEMNEREGFAGLIGSGSGDGLGIRGSGIGGGGDGMREEKRSVAAAPAGRVTSSGDKGAEIAEPSRGERRRDTPQARLSAGEIDDNRHFDDFAAFLRQTPHSHLEPMDVSERLFVRVLDVDDRPVPNAEVEFRTQGRSVFRGRTYANGWTLFHPRSVAAVGNEAAFDVEVRAGRSVQQHVVLRHTKERWQVKIPEARVLPPRPILEVVFLLDTTASMADEIQQLQTTILKVSSDLASLPGQPQLRLGLVLFRDDGDEYVTKLFPLTSDVQAFRTILADVEAGGGGDIPERLEIGLHRTVHEMQWSDTSLRLVFLIGDAPPHPRAKNTHSYAEDIAAAVARGIKVFPVASSGLNSEGEVVFRQLAQFTMAKFIFLTYGASGRETPHDIKPGSFQPESLDRLVVRIVREELSGLELP